MFCFGFYYCFFKPPSCENLKPTFQILIDSLVKLGAERVSFFKLVIFSVVFYVLFFESLIFSMIFLHIEGYFFLNQSYFEFKTTIYNNILFLTYFCIYFKICNINLQLFINHNFVGVEIFSHFLAFGLFCVFSPASFWYFRGFVVYQPIKDFVMISSDHLRSTTSTALTLRIKDLVAESLRHLTSLKLFVC